MYCFVSDAMPVFSCCVLTLQRQLNTLWEMMENKRQEKTELERDVARLRHLNLLDEQLETQVNCLVLDFGHASHTHMSFLGLNFSCLLKKNFLLYVKIV